MPRITNTNQEALIIPRACVHLMRRKTFVDKEKAGSILIILFVSIPRSEKLWRRLKDKAPMSWREYVFEIVFCYIVYEFIYERYMMKISDEKFAGTCTVESCRQLPGEILQVLEC